VAFLPADRDFLVLLEPGSFYQLHVEADHTPLWNAAAALTAVQERYGRFSQIVSVGPLAARLNQLLLAKPLPDCGGDPDIDLLILIDRRVDLLSALLPEISLDAAMWCAFPSHYGEGSYSTKVHPEPMSLPLTQDSDIFRTIRAWNLRQYIDGQKAVEDLPPPNSVPDLTLRLSLVAFTWVNGWTELLLPKHMIGLLVRILTRRREGVFEHAMNYALLTNDWLTVLTMLCCHGACGGIFTKEQISSLTYELQAEFSSCSPDDMIDDEADGMNAPTAITELGRIGLISREKMVPCLDLIEEQDQTAPDGDIGAAMTDADPRSPLHGFVRPSILLVHKIIHNDGKWLDRFSRNAGAYKIEGRIQPSHKSIRRALVFFVGGVTVTELNHL
jgi:hypothetical protein